MAAIGALNTNLKALKLSATCREQCAVSVQKTLQCKKDFCLPLKTLPDVQMLGAEETLELGKP